MSPSLKKLGGRRRTVGSDTESLVRSRPLIEGSDLPLCVEPAVEGVNLASWAAGHRSWIEEKLRHHGGLLFRSFDLSGAEDLEAVIGSVSEAALEYKERSSPRHAVAGNIYTSTDYPPDQPIFLHNENSYQKTWPMKIFFLAKVIAQEGGATPLADVRRVVRHVDPAVRRRFEEQGWMYVRNFGTGFGLDWRTVFQTEDRDEVEAHCRASGIRAEWLDDGRLRTTAVRPAVTPHPVTGEELWFNHATFFHVSTLEPSVRQPLLAEFEEKDLPANTYYGDGSSIEPQVLEGLRQAYRQETVRFPWRKGDLLVLDNMLVAHGREAFTGDREVLVGMAEPQSRAVS